jgi:lipopolysaccharide biosynthesis glycosyltransferase
MSSFNSAQSIEDMAKEEVAVAFAADENIAIGLYVAVYSVVRNANSESEYTVYVLDGGLSTGTKKKIKQIGLGKENIKIEIIEDFSDETSKLKDPDRVGRSSYLRFLIPSIISEKHDKLIYLDSDVLVSEDVCNMVNQDMGKNTVMATQDFLLPTVRDAEKYTRLTDVIDLPDEEPYFNSGVLVIDLERWKDNQVSNRCIDMIYKNNDKLVMDDQDALNGVLYKKWGMLDPRWNVQLNWMENKNKTFKYDKIIHEIGRESILNNPYIIHYNIRKKPWDMGARGRFRTKYFEYLRASDWFGGGGYYRYVLTKYVNHVAHECYRYGAEVSRPIRRKLRLELNGSA